MPQVHNRQRVLDADPLMVVRIDFTDDIQRQVNALNAREEKSVNVQLRYLERQTAIQEKKYEKTRKRIMEKLNKTIAYQLVLRQHKQSGGNDNISETTDHSIGNLQHEVKAMIEWLQPESIRDRKAKALIAKNRKHYDMIVQHNKRKSEDMFCPRDDHVTHISHRNAVHVKDRHKRFSLPNINKSTRDAALCLRHSSGSMEQRKPSHHGNNAQITMSMMMRQESFINTKDTQKALIEQRVTEGASLKAEAGGIVIHRDENKPHGRGTHITDGIETMTDSQTIEMNTMPARKKKVLKQTKATSELNTSKLPELFKAMNIRERLPAIVQ